MLLFLLFLLFLLLLLLLLHEIAGGIVVVSEWRHPALLSNVHCGPLNWEVLGRRQKTGKENVVTGTETEKRRERKEEERKKRKGKKRTGVKRFVLALLLLCGDCLFGLIVW